MKMSRFLFLVVVSSLPASACGGQTGFDGSAAIIPAAGGVSGNGGQLNTGGTTATTCTIAGVVYSSGAADPSDACKSCQPSLSTDRWSTRCVAAIAAGLYYTCAEVNGAGYCWGFNNYGQLGNNSTTNSLVPVQTQGLSSGVQAIVAADDYACAVVNGAAYCWGNNDLGGSSSTVSSVPVQVQGLTSGVQAIAAGSATCALVGGGVQCWGFNNYGQLGNGATTNGFVPDAVQVQGLTSGVQAIAASPGHTCAVVSGGVECWGFKNYGQLGNNSSSIDSSVPVQVQGLGAGVQAIAVGDLHTCALVNGVAYCWGCNVAGELGSDTVGSAVPIQVQGLATGVAAIAAGGHFSCALVNGNVYCWGGHAGFNIGAATLTSPDRNFVPALIPGLTGVTAITTGAMHFCALVNGAAYCWGLNNDGQLGNNSTTDSSNPVPVQFP